MKFKNYISDIPENEYRELPAFSYSLLKNIDESGPTAIIDGSHKTSTALEFGSIVDLILTNNGDISSKFWTKTLIKPTASLLELADAILLDIAIYDETLQYVTHENIQNKIKELGLWSKMIDQEKIRAKYDDPIFWEYIKESYEAKGKIIVSQELLEAAEHCANVLKNHEYTKHYFIESEDIEILYQPSILYKFNGTQGKARPDLLYIDHKNKIIKPIDIKTGSELPSKFINSFYHFKYYLQVISYLLAVQSIVETVEEFKDYKIDNFRFLYISKKLSNTPIIWEVPGSLLNSFVDGWISEGRRITGFLELVEDYKFYKNGEIYDTERKLIANNGTLKMELW